MMLHSFTSVRFLAILATLGCAGILMAGAAPKAASVIEKAPAIQGFERELLVLNGEWETAIVSDPSPAAAREWRKTTVPSLEYGNAIQGTRFLWYRKNVIVPETFRGKNVILTLHGARFNAAVWCNGSFIASRLEGFTPLAVDLTGHVIPGQSAQLEIRCQDWSAVFKDDFRLPANADPNGETLRGVPKGRLIAPIGGHFYFFGIWDDVTLEARPTVRSEDVAVITSVRNKNRLTITGETHNGKPGLRLSAAVLDSEKSVLSLTGTAGNDGRFTLAATMPAAHYWSPEDPHLYTLTLSLLDEKEAIVLDRQSLRFGFRELWTEGADFYLNGVKRHLLASSSWPLPRNQTVAEVRQAIADIKASHAVAFRLHTQPWQRRWLDQADELGLMIVEEGALWCDGGGGYAYGEERFWDNVWTHLSGMVRRDRNHPSLVMWSIENEILHCGASGHCACAEERLAEVGRRVKNLDPAHLITYEADHDPGGVADVLGLHYPREMPENTDYPNTADWLGTTVTTGTAGGTAGSWNKDFFWDRKKPLYIGEYLWVFRQDYSAGTVFYGDKAYGDKEYYKNLAKAQAWEIQTVAYRRAGVSGMCPWTIAQEGGKADRSTPLFLAQQNAYTPIAVFQREFDTRFFTGDKVTRTFDVFNDSPRVRTLEVRLSMTGWAKGHSETFTLEPAGHKVIAVNVPMPSRPAPVGLDFEAALYSDTTKLHAYRTRYKVYEKNQLTAPAGKKIIVYDPRGTWMLDTGSSPAAVIKSPTELAEFDPSSAILIIAPNAFAETKTGTAPPVIGAKTTSPESIRRFLEQGAGVLVLEQATLDRFMPDIVLTAQSSTMTFPVNPAHPAFKGLTEDDFKFWRGDHRVTLKEIRRPVRSGVKALLVSGGLDGVEQSPLMEMNAGRGRIVFCQALAGAKFDTEPAARLLFANLVNYLAESRVAPSPVLLVAGGKDAASFRERLVEIGAVFSEPSGRPVQTDLDRAEIILFHGGGEILEGIGPLLKGRLASGRPLTVYWHAPDPASFDLLKGALEAGTISIIASAGPVSLIEKSGIGIPPVLREDIAFLKPLSSSNWYREVEFDATVIDRAVDLSGPGAAADRYEAETWTRSGAYVEPTRDGKAVGFYTNGAASGVVDIQEAGLYRLALSAWATPAEGVWPLVQVKAGGKVIALVSVTGAAPHTFPFAAMLPKGKVKLDLEFVNDLFRNKEDRNLFIDALLVDRSPVRESGLELFSLPPAILQIRPRPGVRVVIDCVRWDINDTNRTKGLRYASSFLSGLGVGFAAAGTAGAEWIEPAGFVPSGEIAAFSRTDASLNLGANGRVRADFTCAAAGRYRILLRGWSTPLKKTYARVTVRVDGIKTAEVEIKAGSPREFEAGSAEISAGRHELSVEFTNDEWAGPGGEDRNLTLMGAAFAAEE
jgi:hypothetical protein